MSTPFMPQAVRTRLRSHLNATCVTLRRVLALFALALLPGVALATTFTDTTTGATFNVPGAAGQQVNLGGISGCAMRTGAHHYATRTLTTNNSTLYTFNVTSSTGFSNGDGSDAFLAIYSGSFNPGSPATNLLACNDDQASGNYRPRFQANLAANTTYTIVTTAWAENVGGSATYDVTPDVTLAGAPVLSAVSVSGVTSTTATLQGTSTAAGTGYFVVQLAAQAAPSAAQVIAGQQSTGAAAISSGNNTVAANTARTFPISSLQPGTAYIAYLVVRDNQVPQLTSVPVAANFTTVAVVPQAPTIGTATAGNTQATVAFTAPTNTGGSAITGYTVTSSPGAISVNGTASPIVVPGLTNGTSYTFTVRAINAIGTGAASSPSNAVVPVGPPTLTNFGPFTRVFGDAASAITAPTSPSAGAFTYTSSNPAVATISGNVVTVVSAGTTTITANQATNGAYTAGTTTATLTVNKAPAVLTGFGNLTRVFGVAPFTLTAPSSNSNGALSYTSSNTAVATLSGTTVTVVGVGTTTLTATQATTANYEAGSATATLTVSAATPTLGAFANRTATFGDAPLTLTAPTSNSAGAFTYASSNPAVATISGSTVTIVGAGSATITATQAANGNYASAQTTASLTVAAAVPTLTNFNALNRTFGVAPFVLTAPTSPSAGAFTYTSSNPAVATISGNTVTVVGVGSATLTATQAANGNYASAQTTAALTVSAATPTLGAFNAINTTFGAAPITLTAPTSNSAGAFTYTSSNPAVATISGSTLTLVGAGSATITATQAANGNYTSAQTIAALTVSAATPTLGAFNAINTTFGAAPIVLSAPTSNSAGAFTYTSSNPAVATISGNTLTLVGAGSATITATQAANGNYTSAQTTAALTVAAATPTLGAFNAINTTFGVAPITLTAPASNSAGAFTYTTSNPAVATISGNTLTLVGAGSATITATQAANGNYASAQTVAPLTVAAAVPTLGSFANLNATFGAAPITLTAPASNSAGAFTYTSSNPSVATISGNVVTIVGSGTATITATQAANGNYAAASTTASLNVGVAVPVLGSFANLNATFGDAPITLTAPSSPSAGAFTYTSSDTSVATVSGNVVTLVGSGTATITATQAANGNYASASTTAQLVVAAATPTLGAFGNLNATFGDAPISLTAPTSNSVGAFTYTSSNPAVATISGNVVTIVGSGTVTITATQAADGNYASTQTTAQLVVGAATPTLGAFGNLNATFGDAPITLVAPTSPSAGAFTYSSSNPAVATISGNVVTIVGSGTATITATQAADGNYASTQTTAQLQVGVAAPVLSNFGNLTATFGDAPITLVAPNSPSAGAFTYTSSNPAVATISGNVVTIVGSGTATITALQAADGNYGAAQITAQLAVGTLAPALSGFGNLTATYGQASFTLTAPTSPSTGAFTYTSSNPAVATVNGNIVTIVGTGTTTLTATQAAQGSYAEASITAQLVVGAAAPTITGFGDLHKVYGQAAFDLVDPTSNSTGAFTYTIDNASVATINGRTVTLTGPGTATITATQAATANYTAASVTAVLVVDSRPDPTQDAEVVGGLQAQMDTALRFANAQQSNVRDRLRQRRSTDAAGTANGLTLNSSGGEGGVSLKPEVMGEGGSGKAWSFWTGGAINAGERKLSGNDNDYDFRSDGVTLGADTRIGKNLLLGVAVGGGWGDTDVGSHGSTVDATQRALTVYGLWHASDSLFIDGQLAVGKLDYDLRRWSTIADGMAIAQRDGSQVFGSLTFGYESSNQSRRLTGYGRIDAGRTTLDAYRETGLGIYDLEYRKQTVEQRSVAVGLEGSHNVKVDWARDIRPYWQIEYRNDFSSRSDAGINYVVAPADEDYRLSLKPWASSNWSAGFGADFSFGNGVIVTALLRHELNVGMGSNTTVGLQFSLDFGGNGSSATASDAPLQTMPDSKTADYKKK